MILGPLALTLLVGPIGCGPSHEETDPSSGSTANGEVAPRGVYEPKTEGSAVELARHLDRLDQQFAQINEPTPAKARAALLAYTDAASKTAAAILEREGISPDLRDRAAATWVTSLRQRLDADPRSLDRFLAAADAVQEKFPNSPLATMAAHAKVDLLATGNESLFPDREKRFDLLSAAAIVLGEADPPHPETAKVLAQFAPAAEQLGYPDRARKMYQLLADRYGDDPVSILAAGNAYRLGLVGQPVKDFRGPGLDGQTIDLEQFRGKVVLIDFWATWCAPCQAEMPLLKALRERLGPENFEILGVSVDREVKDLERFLAQNPKPWPQIAVASVAPSGSPTSDTALPGTDLPAIPETTPEGTVAAKAGTEGPSELELRFGINLLPTKLLIDREGKLVATGYSPQSILPALQKLFPNAKFGASGPESLPATATPASGPAKPAAKSETAGPS